MSDGLATYYLVIVKNSQFLIQEQGFLIRTIVTGNDVSKETSINFRNSQCAKDIYQTERSVPTVGPKEKIGVSLESTSKHIKDGKYINGRLPFMNTKMFRRSVTIRPGALDFFIVLAWCDKYLHFAMVFFYCKIIRLNAPL